MAGAGITHTGLKRDHNEDRLLVRNDLQLWAVADGAGGHNAGEVAAALALRSLENFYGATLKETHEKPDYDKWGVATGDRRIVRAVQKANGDVVEVGKKERKYRGMGTTVVALHYAERSRRVHVAHVGDSRAYRLRDGYLEQLTQDHSLLTDMVEEHPHLDEQAIEHLPTHVVTRAIGLDEHVRVSVSSHLARPSDRYLLCSDGLSGLVSENELWEELERGDDGDLTARRLISKANEAGGLDNIAAVVIDCSAATAEARPSVRAPQQQFRSSPDTSYPEIWILGVEDVDLGERDVAIPSNSVRPSLTEALDDLLGRKRR